MSTILLFRAKPYSSVQRHSKKMLSFLSNDGWSKLPDHYGAARADDSKIPTFSDYHFFLREFEKGVTEPLKGDTTGSVPIWLKGSLLQNGPGKYKFGNSTAKHWFDGSAVIQKFKIKDGEVSYESQLLNTETLAMNTKANTHVVGEFGTPAHPDPCHSIFQRFQTLFHPFSTDNTCVSIYPIDGNLYALTETTKIHQLDVENVKSVGMVDLMNTIEVMSQSAHPHVLKDGSVYNVSLTKGEKGSAYGIFKIPNKQGKGGFAESELVTKVPSSWPMNPGYMHSFGITDNYFILVEQPLTISVKSMMILPFLGTAFADAFRWKDVPVNFHVINRKSGERTTYTTDNFFFFHTINQYEEDGHIVLDLCAYENANIIKFFMVDAMKAENFPEVYKKSFSGRPQRYVIPLSTEGFGNLVKLPGTQASAVRNQQGTVHLTPEKICDQFCELARFDYDRLLSKKYNFFYAINFTDKVEALGKLVKVDISKKKVTHEWYEKGTSPSEPIFIPSPNQKSEDDGVIVFSFLNLENENIVSLVVLDAKDFTELSRTVFKTPGPVNKTIHGWFL